MSHFRVTSNNVSSRDVISCHVTNSCVLQTCRSSKIPKTRLTGHLQPLQVISGQITSLPGHFQSGICSHVTTTSCELQPCKSSNVPKTRLIRLLPPLPGDFRSNDVTSGSLPVMWGHVTSFPVTWRPPPATFSPVKAQTYPKLNLYAFYHHFQLTSGQMTSLLVKWRHFRVTSGHVRSRYVISYHLTATSCEFQPCRSSNVR